MKKVLTAQQKQDQEAITRNRLRGRSRNFNLRQQHLQHEEDVAADKSTASKALEANTVKIRMHRGSREDSMATLESISPTFEAVQEYLQRHYDRIFTSEELSTELYGRGAPKVDWDYIHIIKCEAGVLAYTDCKIELKGKNDGSHSSCDL